MGARKNFGEEKKIYGLNLITTNDSVIPSSVEKTLIDHQSDDPKPSVITEK